MTIPTQDTSRTARLLALMSNGDGGFNTRDFAAVEPVFRAITTSLLQGDGRFRVGELSDHQLRGIDDVVALAPLLR